MIVLAFDIATQTGWACGAYGEKPTFGSFRCDSQGTRLGRRLRICGHHVVELIDRLKPDVIVREAPELLPHDTVSPLVITYALHGQIDACADQAGLRCTPYRQDTVRSHFIGMAKAPKVIGKGFTGGKRKDIRRDWMKETVMKRCRLLGWKVKNDDEGDACALWDYAICLASADAAIERLPLMEAAQR